MAYTYEYPRPSLTVDAVVFGGFAMTLREAMRIPTVLQALEEAWLKHPEQRLGQLICNAARESRLDAFYVEDVEMEKYLRKMRV